MKERGRIISSNADSSLTPSERAYAVRCGLIRELSSESDLPVSEPQPKRNGWVDLANKATRGVFESSASSSCGVFRLEIRSGLVYPAR